MLFKVINIRFLFPMLGRQREPLIFAAVTHPPARLMRTRVVPHASPRDAVEALFFHSYAAEKGLTVTEVRAASRDASARLRTQTGNLQFTYAYFHC